MHGSEYVHSAAIKGRPSGVAPLVFGIIIHWLASRQWTRPGGQITHGHEARRVPPTRSEDQRAGASGNGGDAGLRTGAAAGCGGGAEILSRISCSAACSLVVKSRVICAWPAA